MYLLLIWKTAESIVWLFHTPWTVWMDWRPGLWMLPFHSRGLKDLLVMRSYTNHLKSYMDRYQHHVVCTCTKIINLNVIRNQNEFLIIFPSINCMHLKQQKKNDYLLSVTLHFNHYQWQWNVKESPTVC